MSDKVDTESFKQLERLRELRVSHRDLDYLIDRLQDHIECFLIALEIGSKTTLIADGGVVALARQHLLQVVEDLRTGTQRVAEAFKTERHDHEFLHVD